MGVGRRDRGAAAPRPAVPADAPRRRPPRALGLLRGPDARARPLPVPGFATEEHELRWTFPDADALWDALEPFPGFETAALETTWRFPDAGTLWQAVGRPIFAEAQRPDVGRRLAPFLREDGGGLELRVEASFVSARRPG